MLGGESVPVASPPQSSRLVLMVSGLVALTLVLGIAAVALATYGESTSAWWPAAGTAVIAVLLAPRRTWAWVIAALLVATAASNLVAGRDLGLSLAFAVTNALEAWVVAWLLTRRGAAPRLATVREVTTLIVAAIAGAAVAGVGAGSAVALIEGEPWWSTAFSVFPSHLSAVLTVVPIALARRSEARSTGSALRWIQPWALGIAVVLVFGTPAQLPITFVLFPMLMWGAFALSMRALAIELVVTAAAVTTFTMLGTGPFALEDWGVLERRIVVQGFLWTFVASTLYVSAARIEQLTAVTRVRRREELLRSGILGAPIGMLLLREDDNGRLWIIESNARARRSLGLTAATGSGMEAPIDLAATDEGTQAVVEAVHASTGSDDADDGDRAASVDVSVAGRMLELTATRMDPEDEDTLVIVQVGDVTEQRQHLRAVRQALAAEKEAVATLRAADREREEFVASVSHELRTPITSIVGFVEVLLDEEDVNPVQRRHLEIVERNARRLGGLVEDILALTVATTARRAACDVSRLAADAVQDVSTGAEQRRVSIVMRDSPATFVVGVRADLERILINLLSNAAKFSPPGSTVHVAIDRQGDPVRLTITDEGPGIPADQLEHVFGRFQRGTFATENQVPGVGLGLAMVRELAHRNDFTVRLVSDGEHGTTAVVEMPRSPSPDFTT
ncbi:ATP-binding protein [Demequina sp. NBRC 110051]|uniref:sensor histidine kinase n=1 Tax=Demequina sp. NBRC 110051 TaxID=1570340 RepID=UPI0009FD842E|nr:ATP-binding protein [Demequina sp. NBRC 110051]